MKNIIIIFTLLFTIACKKQPITSQEYLIQRINIIANLGIAIVVCALWTWLYYLSH